MFYANGKINWFARMPETVYFSEQELRKFIDFQTDWFKEESFEKLRAPNKFFRKSHVLEWMDANLIHEADIIEQLESAILDAALWINCGGWLGTERNRELLEVQKKLRFTYTKRSPRFVMMQSVADCFLGDETYGEHILRRGRDADYTHCFSTYSYGLEKLLVSMLIKDCEFVDTTYSSIEPIITDISSFMINEIYRIKLWIDVEPLRITEAFWNMRTTEEVMDDVYKLLEKLKCWASCSTWSYHMFCVDIISAVVKMQIYEKHGSFYRRNLKGPFSW